MPSSDPGDGNVAVTCTRLLNALDRARAIIAHRAGPMSELSVDHAMALTLETATVHSLAGEALEEARAAERRKPVQLQLTREQAIELSLLLSTATCMYGNTKVDEAVQRDVKDVAAPVLAAIERATRKVSDGAGG